MTETNLYKSLQDCLTTCQGLIDKKLTPRVYDAIHKALKSLAEPMQLAIVGKISSSKSTLVNAILGRDDVVRMGQMEETFNVSWLKYGDSQSDIRVVFKDGHEELVPRGQWADWSSHTGSNTLKDKVKYIEVCCEHDILKSINIIDTPGLDALSEIDSQNTISFLKEVKPDAVIMLFTKSIAENTLDLIQKFQNIDTQSFGLNPMNAMGVLSKVDTNWNPMQPDVDVLQTANRVIKMTLYDKYPEVQKSLFAILPISSLLALASSTITDGDIKLFGKLAKVNEDEWCEMLCSQEFFLDESYNTGLTTDEKKNLLGKFGIYGIHLIVERLKGDVAAPQKEIVEMMREKSGFKRFMEQLDSHFAKRSNLIKAQTHIDAIISACEEEKKILTDEGERLLLGYVQQSVMSTIYSFHQFHEWDLLRKIYTKQISIDEETLDEVKHLFGEYGESVITRLRIKKDEKTEDEMLGHVESRVLYWNREYNLKRKTNKQDAELAKTVRHSLCLLQTQLRSMIQERNHAANVLKEYNERLYID